MGRKLCGFSRALVGTWRAGEAATLFMTKEGEIATLSVPDHKQVAKGTLRSLIRSAGLTVDEFSANC